MIEDLKMTIEGFVASWIAEIERSPDKFTTIDITVELTKITQKSMMKAVLGEDITDQEIEFNCLENSTRRFVAKKMNIFEALN